jgi:hypothetical protein
MSRRAVVLLVAALALWLLLAKALEWPALLRPTFEAGISTDAAAFAYAGEMLRHGARPYVDFWDHKPPLVHAINALALALGGGRPWGVWLAGAAALVGAAVLGWRALARLGVAPAAAAVGLVAYAVAVPDLHSSNLTEEYVLPLQWAAVLLFVVPGGGDRLAPGRGAAIGALAGLMTLLRPNLAGVAVALWCVAGIEALGAGRGGRFAAWTGAVALGAAAVLGLALGLLALAGAAGAFVDQVVVYNLAYAGAGLRERIKAAFAGAELAGRHAPIALPIAGWLLVAWRAAARGERRPAALLALVWAPIELALATTSGRPYDHYFLPLLAPLALLTALLVEELLAERARPAAAWALAAAIAIPAVVDVARHLDERGDRGRRTAQVAAAAGWLQAHTAPGAPVFVWGHAADVYFFAHRPPASRFIYPLALVTPGYADSALVAGLLAELERRRPPVILEQPTPLLPPLARWDPAWHYPPDGAPDGQRRHWRAVPALAAFYDYLAGHYALADSVGPERWRAYRRLDSAGAARRAGP